MEDAIKEALAKCSENYFKDKFKSKRAIYFDLESIQDFKLGAILCLIKSETAWEYIKLCLPKYTERLDDEICKYFPALGLKEQQIEAFINDPKNHSVLVKASPMNRIYMEIPKIIAMTFDENRRVDPSNPRFSIYFGTSSVKYDKHQKEILSNLIKQTNKFVDVEIFDRPLREIEEEVVSIIDMYVIGDLHVFFNHPKIMQWISDDKVFKNKLILGYPTIYSKDGDDSDELTLEKLKRFLNIYFNFDYIERALII